MAASSQPAIGLARSARTRSRRRRGGRPCGSSGESRLQTSRPASGAAGRLVSSRGRPSARRQGDGRGPAAAMPRRSGRAQARGAGTPGARENEKRAGSPVWVDHPCWSPVSVDRRPAPDLRGAHQAVEPLTRGPPQPPRQCTGGRPRRARGAAESTRRLQGGGRSHPPHSTLAVPAAYTAAGVAHGVPRGKDDDSNRERAKSDRTRPDGRDGSRHRGTARGAGFAWGGPQCTARFPARQRPWIFVSWPGVRPIRARAEAGFPRCLP